MKLLQMITIALLLISCKKEETTIHDALTDIKESTEVVAKEGTGKVTLECNGKKITAEGICGAIVSMGKLTIAVKDIINPTKVFTIDFNSQNYPEDGKVYTVKAKDYTAEGQLPEDEISVSFMEGLPNNKMNTWGSEKGKGKIQFVFNGNEVKCTFKDIQLSASEIYNADDLKGIGHVSGEFTFYKN